MIREGSFIFFRVADHNFFFKVSSLTPKIRREKNMVITTDEI